MEEWKKEKQRKQEQQQLYRNKIIDERVKELAEIERKRKEIQEKQYLKYIEKVDRNIAKKAAKKKEMKRRIEQQRKFNIEEKKRQRQREKASKDVFGKFWKTRNLELKELEDNHKLMKRKIRKEFSKFNQELAKEKENCQQGEILQEYIIAEQT